MPINIRRLLTASHDKGSDYDSGKDNNEVKSQANGPESPESPTKRAPLPPVKKLSSAKSKRSKMQLLCGIRSLFLGSKIKDAKRRRSKSHERPQSDSKEALRKSRSLEDISSRSVLTESISSEKDEDLMHAGVDVSVQRILEVINSLSVSPQLTSNVDV
jgi:hypothetical protein